MKFSTIFISSFFILFFKLSFSQIDTLVFNTTYLKKPDTCMIFTPSNYLNTSESYPAIFLLNGYGGNYSDFNRLFDLQKISNTYNTLIICPDGLDSWYFDSPIKRDSKFETFFFQVLYPKIISEYRVDSSLISISGLSMGGHGAMYLFLRHSEKFLCAASSSGTMDLNFSSQKFHSISNLLGEYSTNKERFDKFSAINQLDSIQYKDKKIFIDCGNKDFLLDANQLFKNKCDSMNIDLYYQISPGRHNSEYWKKSFEYHFLFISQQVLLIRPSYKNQ